MGSAQGLNSKFRIRPDDFVPPNTWVGTIPWVNWAATESRVIYRHQDHASVGFLDGHAKAMRRGDVNKKATTEDGSAITQNEMQFILWNRL